MQNRIQNKIFIVFSAITALFLLNALAYSLLFFKNAVNEYSFSNSVVIILCLLIQVALVFALFKFINTLEGKYLRILKYLIFAVFIVLESVFLLFVYSIPNTDAYRCIDTAVGFLNNNYPTVNEAHPHYWYYCDFSNNNLFTMILYVYFKVFRISANYVFFSKLLNAVLILVAVFLAYLCAKLLLGQKNAVKTLALFTLNPVFYTHIQWIYTLTFSLPVMMAIIYFGLRVLKETSLKKRVVFSSIIGLFSSIGYLIRPTSVFPLVAFVIIAVTSIKFNKDFFKKASAVAMSLIFVFGVSYFVINNLANSRFEKTLKHNLPITHWIMMGITDQGVLDKNDVILTRSFGETKAEKQKGNIKEIKKRFSEKSAGELFRHFQAKIRNTFTDGTYNIATRYNSSYAYSTLKTYTTGQNSTIFSLFCQGFKVFSLFFSFLGIFFMIKKKEYTLMPLVILVLGGFVFYMFWESKQSYSLPFLLPELILSVYAFSIFDKETIFETKPKKIATSFACIALIIGVIFAPPVKQRNLESSNTSIKLFSVKDINCISKGEIKQEFISNIRVNRITIFSKKIDQNCVAKISIADENGKKVFSDELLHKRFNSVKNRTGLKKRIKYQCFNLRIKGNRIKKNIKYTIIINSKNIYWFEKKSLGSDFYDGDLYIDNKKQPGDLLLSMKGI